jgi:hypothetical protein
MSIRSESIGKKFPNKLGLRPMPREHFASRVIGRCCNAWETVILSSRVVTRVARGKRRAIGGMNRPTGWLAWSLCALSLTSVIVWASFRVLNSPTPTGVNQESLPLEVWWYLLSVSFATVGALVTSRQPKNPIGWISVPWASPPHPQLRAGSTPCTPW